MEGFLISVRHRPDSGLPRYGIAQKRLHGLEQAPILRQWLVEARMAAPLAL